MTHVKIRWFSMAYCKVPTVSKFLPQNCVFYRKEIHGTVFKQPIRIEYLIKEKPRGALVEKQVLTEGSLEGIEEVGSCQLLLL